MKKAARKPCRTGTPLSLETLALVAGGELTEVRIRKAEIDGDSERVDLKSERVQ